MTSSPNDKKPKTTLEDGDITSGRNETRRTFLKRTGLAGAVVVGGGIAAQRVVAADAVGAGSDTDPNDPYGGGSDNDPNDPYGAGTDSDVGSSSASGSDVVGNGTDSDPNDAVGYGTDSD